MCGEEGYIYSREIMSNMVYTLSNQLQRNNLEAFKAYLESPDNPVRDSISAIQYVYHIDLNLFRRLETGDILQVNPNQVFAFLGAGGQTGEDEAESAGNNAGNFGPMGGNNDIWQELLDNQDLLRTQYDILAGRFPESHNEVVLIINEDNTISDFTLYALGLRDTSELMGMFAAMQRGEEIEELDPVRHTFEELLELEFKLILNSDYFERVGNVWVDRRHDSEFVENLFENAETINIVGILRPNEESVATAMSAGVIGYTPELKRHVINRVNESEIVREQRENPEINIFTGMNFPTEEEMNAAVLTGGTMGMFSTFETNLLILGAMDLNTPASIRIFPANFEGKENITDMIDNYNQRMRDEGREDYVINYTDIVGMMMSSITVIINVVSYVLIAFVGISLVVSSIMIGIITYISVLERTKEIGILRSIGASKKDISRVFNAETFIVGIVAGLIGIGITLLLTIPANIIIHAATGVSSIAQLPLIGGIVLVIISMLLTMGAGLIPAKMASKRDPVIALRTE